MSIFPYWVHVSLILPEFLIARASFAKLARNFVRSSFIYILVKLGSVVFAALMFFFAE